MNFLHWYDWIQPTNPYASIFFGIIITIIITFVVSFDAKKIKTVFLALITGLSVTIIGVILLNVVGFYG